ncbi:hypothetical protein LOC54_04435 [Acetobacter sp. AN02]|uniref:hypothetical protein n=1 Tax=Acetobacter sp. AN02 TaxID=2894186 RepID=UPI0024346679|nr:hypothetical protein [Acetobacter sp. AN02]MDG6094365.1 hypothetical protein [Acetobacter sp. AN02]
MSRSSSDNRFRAGGTDWARYWVGKDVRHLAQAYGELHQEMESWRSEALFLRGERFRDGRSQAELAGLIGTLQARIEAMESQIANMLSLEQWQREQIVSLSLENHALTNRIAEMRSWPEGPVSEGSASEEAVSGGSAFGEVSPEEPSSGLADDGV